MGRDFFRSKIKIAMVIGLLAFFVRLGHFFSMHADPVRDILVLDSLSYDQTALRIVEEGGFPKQVYFQAPLYPYILSVIYRFFGHSMDAVRLLQMGIDAISSAVIALIAFQMFGGVPAVLSGFFAAFYPVLIFQSGLILKTTWNVFFMAIIVLLTLRQRYKCSYYQAFFIGGISGLAAALQGSILLQLPFIAMGASAGCRNAKPLKWMLLFCVVMLGFAGAVSPFTLHNYLSSGEFVLLTAQGGANFYLGNSPYSDGTSKRPPRIRMTPAFEQEDFHREAERALGRRLTPKEASSYWMHEALRWMRENPKAALKLQLRKLGLFWNKVEIPDNYSFDFYRRYSPWIRFPRYPFLWLAIPALLGVVCFSRRWRDLWFLYVMLFSYCAIWVAFHIYSRYRLPVVVFLFPFAGAFLHELFKRIVARKTAFLWKASAGAIGLYIVMSLPLTHYTPAQYYFNLGHGLTRMGDVEGAIEAYMSALEVDPNYTPAMINLGKIYYRYDREKAEAFWKHALEIQPDSEEAYNNLGTLAVQSGNLDDAEKLFRKAVQVQPYYFLGWLQLGQVLQLMNRDKEAVEAFRKALDLKKADPQALFNLAVSLDKLHDADALGAWEEYIRHARGIEKEQNFIEHARKRIEEIRSNITHE